MISARPRGGLPLKDEPGRSGLDSRKWPGPALRRRKELQEMKLSLEERQEISYGYEAKC